MPVDRTRASRVSKFARDVSPTKQRKGGVLGWIRSVAGKAFDAAKSVGPDDGEKVGEHEQLDSQVQRNGELRNSSRSTYLIEKESKNTSRLSHHKEEYDEDNSEESYGSQTQTNYREIPRSQMGLKSSLMDADISNRSNRIESAPFRFPDPVHYQTQNIVPMMSPYGSPFVMGVDARTNPMYMPSPAILVPGMVQPSPVNVQSPMNSFPMFDAIVDQISTEVTRRLEKTIKQWESQRRPFESPSPSATPPSPSRLPPVSKRAPKVPSASSVTETKESTVQKSAKVESDPSDMTKKMTLTDAVPNKAEIASLTAERIKQTLSAMCQPVQHPNVFNPPKIDSDSKPATEAKEEKVVPMEKKEHSIPPPPMVAPVSQSRAKPSFGFGLRRTAPDMKDDESTEESEEKDIPLFRAKRAAPQPATNITEIKLPSPHPRSPSPSPVKDEEPPKPSSIPLKKSTEEKVDTADARQEIPKVSFGFTGPKPKFDTLAVDLPADSAIVSKISFGLSGAKAPSAEEKEKEETGAKAEEKLPISNTKKEDKDEEKGKEKGKETEKEKSISAVGFTFGATKAKEDSQATPISPKKLTFGFGAVNAASSPKEDKPPEKPITFGAAPTFSFGGASSTNTAAAPVLELKAKPMGTKPVVSSEQSKPAPPTFAPAPEKITFSFGGSSSATSATSPKVNSPTSGVPGFAPAWSSSNATGNTQSGPIFGGAASTASSAEPPKIGFGAPKPFTTTATTPGQVFSFGGSTSSTNTITNTQSTNGPISSGFGLGAAAPSFGGFSATTTTDPPKPVSFSAFADKALSSQGASSSGFTFGGPAPAPTSTLTPTSSAPVAAPGGIFGTFGAAPVFGGTQSSAGFGQSQQQNSALAPLLSGPGSGRQFKSTLRR